MKKKIIDNTAGTNVALKASRGEERRCDNKMRRDEKTKQLNSAQLDSSRLGIGCVRHLEHDELKYLARAKEN